MKFRAIVFEDDDSVRKLLINILERREYEVVSAQSPAICPVYEDLTTLCPHEFACGDFLITDNHMPLMNGLEFVKLQSQRGCKGVVNNKAIASALWENDDIDVAEQLGCKVFDKPFDISKINKWLDEQEKKVPSDRKLEALGNISHKN